MEQYHNESRDSGVVAYEIGRGSIVVKFVGGEKYLYTDHSAGARNIALLRRPPGLDQAGWLHRWQHDHTSVAIETQSIFGYTQNWVVRALTPEGPGIDGIVEELFPAEAITDLKAFFGAADDNDLQDRLGRMVASTAAFGANENIDTVPTSRYVFKTPFKDFQ